MSDFVSGEATQSRAYLPVIDGMALGLRHGRNVVPRDAARLGAAVRQPAPDGARRRPLPGGGRGCGRADDPRRRESDEHLLVAPVLRWRSAGRSHHRVRLLQRRQCHLLAYVCQRLHAGTKVFALDTFQGMPSTDKTIDAHNAGDFADVLFDDLDAYVRSLYLDNLTLVRGQFDRQPSRSCAVRAPSGWRTWTATSPRRCRTHTRPSGRGWWRAATSCSTMPQCRAVWAPPKWSRTSSSGVTASTPSKSGRTSCSAISLRDERGGPADRYAGHLS